MKSVEYYDSYITDEYAKTAIEVEKDALKEMMDTFDAYYNGLWDKYNAQNVNREIRTRGR